MSDEQITEQDWINLIERQNTLIADLQSELLEARTEVIKTLRELCAAQYVACSLIKQISPDEPDPMKKMAELLVEAKKQLTITQN